MLYHADALLHFRSVRHSIVAVSESVAVRRQHRWRDRISTYLYGPRRLPVLRPIGNSNESESAVRYVAGSACRIVAALGAHKPASSASFMPWRAVHRRLTIPSSGLAFGQPLKSNVRALSSSIVKVRECRRSLCVNRTVAAVRLPLRSQFWHPSTVAPGPSRSASQMHRASAPRSRA